MAIKFDSFTSDTFGKYLKRIREEKNISLEEVSRVTKIKLRFLKAIEDEQIEDVINSEFARLYILNYARFICADIKTVMKLFDEKYKQSLEKKKVLISFRKKKKYEHKILIPKLVFKIIALLVFIAILFWIGLYLHRKGSLERNLFEKTTISSLQDTIVQNDEISPETSQTKNILEREYNYKTEDCYKRYIIKEKNIPWYVVPEYIKSK
ncbi:MAG: helix-turn-helix domain-containing protein [Candidatus Cloacimonetes bacterium]|nr:helix-turn-helix domain-containing protein [Candidatus Cloacimonadota bacterium]MBL7087053.1 helix-turn-helix domain-containing protein [Candidatus Cloacimonadota bacterium]